MEIDPDLCVGCELCLPYCPMDAIYLENRLAKIVL
ncbi:MAG: 4Fe-4S binding protein, partial [Candidatus Bathyarchaeota archaeon]